MTTRYSFLRDALFDLYGHSVSLIIGIRMNGSAHAGVIRFRFVRSATPIKGADFGGAIFSLEPRFSSYSKGIEQLDTHLAVSRC